MTAGPSDPQEMLATIQHLQQLAAQATTADEVRQVTARITAITRQFKVQNKINIPTSLIDQAVELDPKYRVRPHLQYLSDRVTQAIQDVENGHNRIIAVSMPPRAGKSTTLNLHGPIYILRQHPDWKIVSTSHDGNLVSAWARGARQIIERKPSLGIALAPDGGAGGYWDTLEGGGMFTVSVRGALTGRGAKVLFIDDPIKDFVESHSAAARQTLWDWWLSVAQTRLEPPYLVIVVMTRWHEDDFVGRLFSLDYEGDPASVERISLPAIADAEDDVLGRAIGEPLFSPLAEETREQALERWHDVRRAVGSYTFNAMYQQHPSSPKGAIFDTGWWKFWTMDPDKATEDGRVVYLDPSSLTGGKWLDSWDANFDSNEAAIGGWVVGQRWVRSGPNRYLIAQQRGKWSFTQTLAAMRRWAGPSDWSSSPCGSLVHLRVIEKKANGAAIIDVLKSEISGLRPTSPHESKEARARAVTPEVESGNVYLPHPSDPGMEWVRDDYLPELRDFPNGFSDDQVDSTTQALNNLREDGKGAITVPGRTGRSIERGRAAAATTDRNRYRR